MDPEDILIKVRQSKPLFFILAGRDTAQEMYRLQDHAGVYYWNPHHIDGDRFLGESIKVSETYGVGLALCCEFNDTVEKKILIPFQY